jgi:uncharacterized protein YjbJ (UPF0337 family)
MNRDQVEGNWTEIKGKIKKKWGKLTDDELAQSEGKRDELIGRIQKHYGDTRENIEKQYDELTRH